MAVPKKKTSKSKRNMRRSHDSITSMPFAKCPRCGSVKQPYHLCKSCGFYKDKDILCLDTQPVTN